VNATVTPDTVLPSIEAEDEQVVERRELVLRPKHRMNDTVRKTNIDEQPACIQTTEIEGQETTRNINDPAQIPGETSELSESQLAKEREFA
jgi:hypothetical protein